MELGPKESAGVFVCVCFEWKVSQVGTKSFIKKSRVLCEMPNNWRRGDLEVSGRQPGDRAEAALKCFAAVESDVIQKLKSTTQSWREVQGDPCTGLKGFAGLEGDQEDAQTGGTTQEIDHIGLITRRWNPSGGQGVGWRQRYTSPEVPL